MNFRKQKHPLYKKMNDLPVFIYCLFSIHLIYMSIYPLGSILLSGLSFVSLEVMISFIFLSSQLKKYQTSPCQSFFLTKTCPTCPLSVPLLPWDSEKDLGGHRRRLLPRLH